MLRFWAILSFAFLGGLGGTGCRKEISALGMKIAIEQTRLSNGMQVIVVEDPTLPIISYQTWLGVGSSDDPPGKTGLAHLFEHLMFKGTEKYGKGEFFRQLETRGAEVNAETTRDYTLYYSTFTPDLLSQVIEMESDRLSHLRFDEASLQQEKLVVLEERRLRYDSRPDSRIQEALWALAFRSHSYRYPVIGVPEDLLNIQLEDLQAFFGRFYAPSNVTLVLTGRIRAKEVLPLIQAAYGGIRSKTGEGKLARLRVPATEVQNEERRQVIRDRVTAERGAFGYPITSASHADSHSLDVLANILFEGNHSRAHRRLVEELNWVTSVGGTAFTPKYPGLFMIQWGMKVGLASQKAETELGALIQDVQERGVTEAEVKTAVKQLTVQMMDSIRSAHGLGHWIGTVETILGDAAHFSDDLSKYARVTPADVQRVARKYLEPNRRSVVTLLPSLQANTAHARSAGREKK